MSWLARYAAIRKLIKCGSLVYHDELTCRQQRGMLELETRGHVQRSRGLNNHVCWHLPRKAKPDAPRLRPTARDQAARHPGETRPL